MAKWIQKPVLAAALVLSWSLPALAEYEAGQLAHKSGNLREAYLQWDTSARLGESQSQRALGLMLKDGNGVVQDYVSAHMWLNLAAAQGDAQAAKERDLLARRMSAEQVAEAQRKATQFKPEPGIVNQPKPASNDTVAAAPREKVTATPVSANLEPASFKLADPLVGVWFESKHGFVISIEESQEGGFLIKQALKDDKFSYAGDVIGEFDEGDDEDSYSGRHLWGGERSRDAKWGKEGGLVLRRVNDKTLFMQYTDSKYQDGWTYEKIK